MKNRILLLVAPIYLIGVISIQAQALKQIKQLVRADSSRLVEIFKDLHQNPELAFMEVRTAGIVAKELQGLGYTVTTGIAKTGVAGILKNGEGPVVMFRADMDCNTVKETTGLSYASTKTMKNAAGVEVPVMHACGHDAHITWMLGIAKIMVALKTQWAGTLIFVAQPAEEVGQGAKAMIADKLYEKGIPEPDYLFGMHTYPLEIGKIDNAPGVRMAGTDQLDVTFYGIGGHGSSPEHTKDPIVMGANAVLQYQTVISRNIPAQEVGVLTVGEFKAGNSNNVIPSSALLKLNLRWMNETTRTTIIEGIKRINEGIAVANNLPKDLYPSIEFKATASPLVNNKEMVEKINIPLVELAGKENVITDRPPLMPSEDFQYLVLGNKKAIYDYLFIGVASKPAVAQARKGGKQYPFFNHNGNYLVDLAAIPFGTEVGTTALLELFKKPAKTIAKPNKRQ